MPLILSERRKRAKAFICFFQRPLYFKRVGDMGADASRANRTNGDLPPVSYFEAAPQSAFLGLPSGANVAFCWARKTNLSGDDLTFANFDFIKKGDCCNAIRSVWLDP
jgi:hypothetical protein